MKFPFLALAVALVVPLTACNTKNIVNAANLQSPVPQSSPSPETTLASVTKDWYNYTAKDSSYSAKFPGQPEEENQSTNSPLGELKYIQASYLDNANSRIYLMMSIKYPVSPSQYDVEKGLDGVRDGQARGSKYTVTSEKKISFNGFPGREIILQGKQGELIKSHIFIDPQGPTLYQMMVGADDGNLAFPEAQAFLNSLAIPK